VLPRTPVESLQAELTHGAPTPNGTLTDFLVAGLDAITERRIAHAARTDGPQQAAAIKFLRQQHDDIRTVILTNAYGALSYPMP
jgi:hypothetical protein